MSDTSETPAIDEKKETTSPTPTDPATEAGTFFSNLGVQLLTLLILVIAGGLMLWSARVAQTNIMPTLIDAEPFTSAALSLATSPVNINVVKTTASNGEPTVKSTKIEFPLEENMRIIKYGFYGLESIRDWTDGPKSTPFWRYLGTIYEKMIINFVSNTTNFYNILNTNCSESVIVFIMPYLLYFIWPFILLGFGSMNMLYGLFLMFYEIPKLFSEKDGCYKEPVSNIQGPVYEKDRFDEKKNEWIYKKDANGSPIPEIKTRIKWNDPENATKENRLTYFWYIFLVICSIFMQVGPFTLFCFSFRSLFTALFLPLCLQAVLVDNGTGSGSGSGSGTGNGSPEKDDKQPSKYTLGKTIVDILKYKLNIIMYIVSYFVVKDASLSMGTMGAVIAVVACIIVYAFYPGIYKPSNGDGSELTDKMADFYQESKDFIPTTIPSSEAECDVATGATMPRLAVSETSKLPPYSKTPFEGVPLAQTIQPSAVPTPSAPPADASLKTGGFKKGPRQSRKN
jgi:hypothetical protein